MKKMTCKYWWLLLVMFTGCAGHPDPPQPAGQQIPLAPELWNYHGNEIFPAKVGN